MDKTQETSNILPQIPHHAIPQWSDLPEIDLYMDQVIALMDKYLCDNSSMDTKFITPSMINNYVKLGIMPAPVKKKYSREHLAYLIIICSLKQVMPISHIKMMIEQKLQQNTIAETLDFYSNLYDFTYQTLLETCQTKLISNEINLTTQDDLLLFTAISAAHCSTISNKLFSINHPQISINKKKTKEN